MTDEDERSYQLTMTVLDVAARGQRVLSAGAAKVTFDLLLDMHKKLADETLVSELDAKYMQEVSKRLIAESNLATARNDALEEAARMVEMPISGKGVYPSQIAEGIRAIKSGAAK